MEFQGTQRSHNPLVRYLHKQIGRPWDKVYSEIKRTLPKGIHADHIWSHVKSAVHFHCWEQDGKTWYLPRFFGHPVEVVGLYVHPRTGLLRLKPERKSQASSNNLRSALTRIELGENSYYRSLRGIWYYLEFEPVDPLAPSGQLQLVKKKQLNHKELRQLRATYPNAA